MSIGEISNTINTNSEIDSLTRRISEARFKEAASRPVEKQPQETEGVTDGQKKLALDIRERYEGKINEIKDFATSIGEDLTEEDICYALKYGRSVLADYSA